MTLDEAQLTRRLDVLEATAEVGRLKRRYVQLCDSGYDGDAIAALFSATGKWTSSQDGPLVGRDQISSFMSEIGSTRFSWAGHYLSNEVVDIEIEAGRASGRWDLIQLATTRESQHGASASILAMGTYRDQFARIDGRWVLTEVNLELHRVTDLETGW